MNVAGLVIVLAKAGFGAIKDLNMALKSLGMDIKAIDEGIYALENSSKKVAGKLSKEAEELRAELKKIFGNKAESEAKSGKDILDNITKVGYGETDLSKGAIQFRQANNITSPGRNVAVFEYMNNSGELETLTTVSNKGLHAEEVGFEYFEENGIDTSKITRIYTEREPCVETETNVGKNCTKKISDYCPNAEVSYSVDYGLTKESGQLARNTLKELISNYVK